MFRHALALMILAAATISPAQKLDDQDYKLGVNVELVQLPVSVLDKKGFPIKGLQPEHFAVYEDKVLQNISLFKQEDIPLSVGLVVDASSSMYDKRDRLSVAAMTFVRESNPEDETAILSFGDIVNLEQEFTTSTNKLNRALNAIPSNGNTALYDAVALGAQHVKEEGFHEKKVLLVVSDGEDNHSKYKLKQVLTAIQESKIIVYTVGLLSQDTDNVFGDEGKKALKQLAEAGGGASFFPKNAAEVEEVCRRIARDLRNQYTIGYKPTNEKLDGSFRKVIVKVNPPKTVPKVTVHTKKGYYAPVTHETQVASERTVK
jgi:Ca-activated chloride channel family protein